MCAKSCQCNLCHKKKTCTTCEYIDKFKVIDCRIDGVQECEYQVNLIPRDEINRKLCTCQSHIEPVDNDGSAWMVCEICNGKFRVVPGKRYKFSMRLY